MKAFCSSGAPFKVRRLTPKLGAEISGLDIGRGVAPDVLRALHDAFLEYQVFRFPAAEVPPRSQVASRASSARCRCT